MKIGQPRIPKAIAVANNNIQVLLVAANDNFEQILPPSAGMIDGGFPGDNYSNIETIDGGTP